MQKYLKKLYILFSILFFIASAGIFLFLNKTIEDKKKLSEDLMAKWEAEVERREDIKSLDKAVKAIEKERMELEAHFAKSSNIVPFLNNIEELAASAKVDSEVTSVDILPDKTALSVGLQTKGDFMETYKFLGLLENSPYHLEFLSMDIERAEGEEENVTPTWNGTFRIKLLSFVE